MAAPKFEVGRLRNTMIQIKNYKSSFKILFWIVTKSSPTLDNIKLPHLSNHHHSDHHVCLYLPASQLNLQIKSET